LTLLHHQTFLDCFAAVIDILSFGRVLVDVDHLSLIQRVQPFELLLIVL